VKTVGVKLLVLGVATWELLFPSQAKVMEAATDRAGVAGTDNRVEKKLRDQPKWGVCQVGDVLVAGDRIRTGPDSGASLLLADKTLLRLSQNTEVCVVQLDSGESGSLIRRFQLATGKLWSDVTPAEQAGSVFEVRGPNAVAAVKGTSFEVSSESADTDTEVNVFEGDVECVNPEVAEAPVHVGPEQAYNQFRASRGKAGRRTRFNPENGNDWQRWNLQRLKAWKQTRNRFPRRLQLDRKSLQNFARQHHQSQPRRRSPRAR
jgi:hypothetical protein